MQEVHLGVKNDVFQSWIGRENKETDQGPIFQSNQSLRIVQIGPSWRQLQIESTGFPGVDGRNLLRDKQRPTALTH